MSGPANSVVRHCPVLQFQSTPKIVQGRAGSDPKNYFWVGSLHLWIGLSRVKKIGPTSKLHSNTCMPDVTELLTRLSAYQIRQRSNENCRLHTSATAQNTKTRLLRLRSGDFCFLLQTSVDKTENTWKPEVSCCPMYCVAVKWNSCRIRFPNLVQIRWKLRTHSVVCQREPSWYRKRVTSWWLFWRLATGCFVVSECQTSCRRPSSRWWSTWPPSTTSPAWCRRNKNLKRGVSPSTWKLSRRWQPKTSSDKITSGVSQSVLPRVVLWWGPGEQAPNFGQAPKFVRLDLTLKGCRYSYHIPHW